MMSGEPINWLLEGPAWVQYRTRVDLLGEPEDSPSVLAARRAMIADPQIQAVMADLADWPGVVLTSHKSAGHPIHKLAFIADLGFRAGDPGMAEVISRVVDHRSPEGVFQVLVNVPKAFGGSGEDRYAWMLCDAPLVLYALVKFGLGEDERVQEAVQQLVKLLRENGWPCAAAPDLGKFHGPGRRDDPCPYANLVMLKVLARRLEWRDSLASRTGGEMLLSLWKSSSESRPYLFGMGTDFRKIKAPLVWYDILHVLDVLSQFPWLHEDARLREMAELLKAKEDEQGRFTAGSVWKSWGEWEFGQKRSPSRWLTLLARRVLKRLEGGG